jgi:HD-like signal output (HDOD) protein
VSLWDWIVQRLSGSDGRESRRRSGCDDATSASKAETGVATLEPPDSSAEEGDGEAVAPWWAPEGADLLEPLPVRRPELSAEALALENLLISQFDGHDLNLPPLPRVPEIVLRRLRDPNCDFTKVAGDIAEDQVIAGAVLRMANSALYRARKKVTALQPAVTRLGVNMIRTIMLQQSLRAAMFRRKGADEERPRTIWRRSVASATIMGGLAALTASNSDEAFLIGLLHDIGNVLVLRAAQDQQTVLHHKLDSETFEYLCYETHQELGELIAGAWDLPPTLKDLIADHHTVPAPETPLRAYRLQLELTGMINAMLGYAPAGAYNLREVRAAKDLGLAGREEFVTFLDALPAQVEEAVTMF